MRSGAPWTTSGPAAPNSPSSAGASRPRPGAAGEALATLQQERRAARTRLEQMERADAESRRRLADLAPREAELNAEDRFSGGHAHRVPPRSPHPDPRPRSRQPVQRLRAGGHRPRRRRPGRGRLQPAARRLRRSRWPTRGIRASRPRGGSGRNIARRRSPDRGSAGLDGRPAAGPPRRPTAADPGPGRRRGAGPPAGGQQRRQGPGAGFAPRIVDRPPALRRLAHPAAAGPRRTLRRDRRPQTAAPLCAAARFAPGGRPTAREARRSGRRRRHRRTAGGDVGSGSSSPRWTRRDTRPTRPANACRSRSSR